VAAAFLAQALAASRSAVESAPPENATPRHSGGCAKCPRKKRSRIEAAAASRGVSDGISGARAHMVAVKSTTAALDEIGRWLVGGLAMPVDSVVAVRDVAAGLERLRAGQARGRIVVDVEGGF